MKNITMIGVTIGIFLVVMQGDWGSSSVAGQTFDPRDIVWQDREIFRQGLIPAHQEILSQLEGATVYLLDVEISEDFTQARGDARIVYTNTEEVSLHDIYVRLFPNVRGGRMTLDNILLHDTPVDALSELEDSALRLHLQTPLLPGERVILSTDFEVEIPQTAEAAAGFFGYIDGILALENFYPAIPAYDEQGWSLALPTPGVDFTCYDPALYVVRISAPAAVAIIPSGTIVAQERHGSTQIINVAAGPARDFYLAAGEGLIEKSINIGDTEITSYGRPGEQQGVELALNSARDALAYFGKLFGPYPYTEFKVIATPVQAMGMEYPGVVAINRIYYDLARNFSGVAAPVMLEGIVLHEAAHQWLYNVVGNNQPQEPWLDETLIQYLMSLFYRDSYGAGAYAGFRASWLSRWDRVERKTIPIGMPGAHYQGKEAGAILYGRGALFMEQFAEKLGRDGFRNFLRRYYEQHAWKMATSQSFKALAEKECACNLTPLFEEWIYW